MPKKLVIVNGSVFGTLTVLNELKPLIDRKGNNVRNFLCECTCGHRQITRMHTLIRIKKSCGNRGNHKVSHLKTHSLWRCIKNRCYSSSNFNFHRYGGRGITMCDEWRKDYTSFHKWCTENGWEEGLDIDRINNDGNYEPDNCRFVSRVVNGNNKESTLMVEYNGEQIAFSLLLRKFNLIGKYSTYLQRLKKGWPIDTIVSTPALDNKTRHSSLNPMN